MKDTQQIFIDKKSQTGVLMLHGFSSTPAEFKDLSVYLAEKGFNVSVPLISGHGTSPEDLMKTSPNDWKKSVMDAYLKLKDVSEKIFVIGHSFGSNLAFWLTEEIKEKPVGIITLGAPIFLKYHFFIVLRLYSYGLIKKFYHKPRRIYKTDYANMVERGSYTSIPMKSVRHFLSFIKKETIPSLSKIKIPILIVHSNTDPVIHPKSAKYIYEHIGSAFKRMHWFQSNYHAIMIDERRLELFKEIFDFIKEISRK